MNQNSNINKLNQSQSKSLSSQLLDSKIKLSNHRLLKTGSFVNGQWLNCESTFDVNNPATDDLIAAVCEITQEQLEECVRAADVAQKTWSQVPTKHRKKLLMKWHQLILENLDDLAHLMTIEQGKPIKESLGEISHSASYIEWFAEQIQRCDGDVISESASDRRLLTIRQAIGVVSAITPWNYPMGLITRKAAPAIAAGCAIIVKPSELTPLSALALAQLSQQAGIPKGVFNVVTGMNAEMIGQVLTQHSLIKKFSFTGSTKIGKKLLAQCASTVKRTSLELGGNAPFIIFEDANLEQAVAGVMNSKFRNSGQTCVCANRIFVQRNIYAQFTKLLADRVSDLKIGSGLDKNIDIGPLINEEAVNKMHQLVNNAIAEGATLITGGGCHSLGPNFYSPTLLIDASVNMNIAKQEIFGPIATVIPFDTEEEVIKMANDTPYGLASYLFTENISRCWRVSEALEYGMVGVNEGLLTSVQAPFGGIKESGMGREGSKYGLDDYQNIKYICMGGL